MSTIKSKIFWWQLLSIIGMLFTAYGDLGLVNVSLAGFVSFSITVILQKFFTDPSRTIKASEVDGGNTMLWLNIAGAFVMISDYFLQNKIFQLLNLNPVGVGITVATINMFIRVYFLNPPRASEEEYGK